MSTERKAMQDFLPDETGRLLAGLGLGAVNPGAFSGGEWHAAADAPLIDSINPATGEVIARVRAAGTDDYERVMKSATAAFAVTRFQCRSTTRAGHGSWAARISSTA